MTIQKINHYTQKLLGTLSLFLVIISFSCCSSNQRDISNNAARKKNVKITRQFEVLAPGSFENVFDNDLVTLHLATKKNISPDSVLAWTDGIRIPVEEGENLLYNFNLAGINFGKTLVRIDIFHSDSLKENHLVKLLHLPSEEPIELGYKVIRRIDHDPEAYTQGLIYHEGILYESTGQANRSSVRAVDPKTGEVIRKQALEPQYFGEGIAIVGDEIFMLTYRAQKGFVFDLFTFELKREFNLQTNEGWGLTTYNDTILMSDGTANIYFFKPDNYFTQLKQTEICTNKGLVNHLNELEYTKYGLFSNVYGHSLVYLIDISKGIVTHVLDLSGLVPDNIPRNYDHVLNGIAYNDKTGTFYVTGKQWPVMYEIDILID